MSGKCNRSGMCCNMFWLPKSPQQLKEMAENYVKYWRDENPSCRYDEIYRMIGDRCLGKKKNESYWLYGPCRNLYYTTDEHGKRVAACGIQSVKPEMCRSFPNADTQNYPDNPSQYKGCGFNKNSKHGETLKQMYKSTVQLSDASNFRTFVFDPCGCTFKLSTFPKNCPNHIDNHSFIRRK
jgi:Fe-S-cluster containining protein